ncbi:MAG: hypothetical protein K2L82_08065 [Lachnospiraceae bacterium]|nr:hypothetical protein [Lachnospiraceae bacterium]
MSMEINGGYSRLAANYTERLKEEQPLDRTDKEKEAQKAQNGAKASDKASVPQDEYVSSEKSGAKPSGLYRVGQDENGNKKIFYDDPNKGGEEKCVANTDQVEKEIRELKAKKKQLEQQIQSSSGDEQKVEELERKLAQVESELSRKDNDTYRRQHTQFTEL